jgi:hypothetical protein
MHRYATDSRGCALGRGKALPWPDGRGLAAWRASQGTRALPYHTALMPCHKAAAKSCTDASHLGRGLSSEEISIKGGWRLSFGRAPSALPGCKAWLSMDDSLSGDYAAIANRLRRQPSLAQAKDTVRAACDPITSFNAHHPFFFCRKPVCSFSARTPGVAARGPQRRRDRICATGRVCPPGANVVEPLARRAAAKRLRPARLQKRACAPTRTCATGDAHE